jgi:hypothetical protein
MRIILILVLLTLIIAQYMRMVEVFEENNTLRDEFQNVIEICGELHNRCDMRNAAFRISDMDEVSHQIKMEDKLFEELERCKRATE